MSNSLVLAYMGDAIYEVYVREYLISKDIAKVNELQKHAIKYVSAKGQKEYLEKMINESFFKEEELDIILLDPPYQNNLINESITLIEKNKILKINGLIVCEYTSEHINCNYELIKNKKYGDKYISIYKRTQ